MTLSDRLSADELSALPIFPLPRVVFFPGSVLPLHLFEPRYRDLMEYCLDEGPRAMAIALLKPGYEVDYEGAPAIHRIAGAGRIVDHRRRDDGTYDIALRGVVRVALDERPSKHSFRIAEGAILPDKGDITPIQLRTLLSCATNVAAVVRAKHPEFELGLHPDDSCSQILDTLADRFVADSLQRQGILEAFELHIRYERTLANISEVLAALAASKRPS